MKKDELTIPFNENAKRRTVVAGYLGSIIALIVVSGGWLVFGVLTMHKVMKELTPEQGILRFIPVVEMALITAGWAAMVALVIKVNKLSREMCLRLTGSIQITPTMLLLGRQTIPRSAISRVWVGRGLLYVQITENERKHTVNVPINWLPVGAAEAVQSVLASSHNGAEKPGGPE